MVTQSTRVSSHSSPFGSSICKYHTSNDVFSRCKSVHKMASGKSDDELTQPELGQEVENSEQWIEHDCVVTLHDAYTNDNMTIDTDFHNDWAWARSVWFFLVCTSSHTRTVAQEMSLSHQPHVHVHVSVSPRLALPFVFPALPAALLPLPLALEVRRLPEPAVHSTRRVYGLFWRVTTSRRPQSSPTRSSWTRRRSSPTKSLLRTPTTMTLHSRICFTKHTEHMPITLYEKTCLSGCRRCHCPIKRGDPLSKETRKHRLGLCLTNKKSKFLQSAKQELTNTNFIPLTTEEVY